MTRRPASPARHTAAAAARLSAIAKLATRRHSRRRPLPAIDTIGHALQRAVTGNA